VDDKELNRIIGGDLIVKSSGFASVYVLPQLSICKPSLRIDGKGYFLCLVEEEESSYFCLKHFCAKLGKLQIEN
jgi:hypothetical protein